MDQFLVQLAAEGVVAVGDGLVLLRDRVVLGSGRRRAADIDAGVAVVLELGFVGQLPCDGVVPAWERHLPDVVSLVGPREVQPLLHRAGQGLLAHQ
eukprot:10545343-Lingulodinium_polyedra.AAC.1